MKLKVIEDNEDFIVVELPRTLFKGKIPEHLTLKNFEFEY